MGWLGGLAFVCGLTLAATSACHEGDRISISGSCKKYLECNSGNMVLKSCGIGHSFDPVALECAWSWKVNCSDLSKECDDGTLYPHSDSCRLYYSCHAGRLSLEFCPLLKVFLPELQECRFGLRCNTSECAGKERATVPGKCGSYMECSEGQWKEHSCLPLYNYNPATQTCAFGGCKQCSENDTAPGSACNAYQECNAGVWEDRHCGPLRRFDPSKKKCVWWFQYTCPKTLTFNTKLTACNEGEIRSEDSDCSKFSICSGGGWLIQDCPSGLLFDSKTLFCVPGSQATCSGCQGDEADPQSCGSYWTCDLGKKYKKSCGFMKNYDASTGKCVYYGAECFPGDKCVSGKRATTGCKDYEECVNGRYYKRTCGMSRVFDSNSQTCTWVWPWESCSKSYNVPECVEGDTKILTCNKYVKCQYGIWNVQNCEDGKTFNGESCVSKKCKMAVKDCGKYSINGMDLECVPGEYFDLGSKSCVSGKCKDSSKVVNSCNEGETKAVEGSCKAYKVCRGNEWIQETCKDCLNYNEGIRGCGFAWEYPCNGPTQEPTTPTQQPTTPTQQPTTPTQPPTTPTEQPTTPTEQPTTPTQPPTTPTEQPTTPTQPPTTPTQPPTTSTQSPTTPTSTQQPTSSTEQPTTKPTPCIEGSLKPDPENCRDYFECKNGKYERNSCSLFQKFDAPDLKCKYWNVRCAN